MAIYDILKSVHMSWTLPLHIFGTLVNMIHCATVCYENLNLSTSRKYTLCCLSSQPLGCKLNVSESGSHLAHKRLYTRLIADEIHLRFTFLSASA